MSGHLWLSFAFLSASIYATRALFDKAVLDRDVYGLINTTILISFPMFVVFVLLGLLMGETGLTMLSSDIETIVTVVLATVGGLIYIVNLMAYLVGLEVTEVSRFVPLLSTNIILVLLFEFLFLGENFPPIIYGGVFAVFVGGVLISLEDFSGFALTMRSLNWALLTAGSYALYTTVTKYLTFGLSLFQIIFWIGFGGILFAIVIQFWAPVPESMTDDFSLCEAAVSLSGGLLMIRGIAIAIALVSFTRAVETGPVSLVVAVVKLDVFMVFFGTVVLTHIAPEVLYEEVNRRIFVQKLVASILVVGGVILINVFTA